MKKTRILGRAALGILGALMLATACSSDDNSGGDTGNIVGTWSFKGRTWVFTDNTITFTDSDDEAANFRCGYTYEKGVLTYTVDYDGVPGTTQAVVKFLYNGRVLVLKYKPDWAEDYSLAGVADVLYKDGRAPDTPVGDIQGTWHWYMQGDESYIRAGVTIKGNNIEIIITPWGERHVGTFTYKGGFLNLNITESYSARGTDGQGFGSGFLDPATLESSQWWPVEGLWYLDNEMPFIAGGSEAYGKIANLPAIFVRK